MDKAHPADEAQSGRRKPLGGEFIDESIVERFEFHARVADWLALSGMFGYLFAYVTGWKLLLPPADQQFTIGAWLRFISDVFAANGLAPVLALAAIANYVRGREFAKRNIAQLRSLFADENTPTRLRSVGRLKIYAMIYLQLAIYSLLVLSCSQAWLFGVLLMGLQCFHLYFNNLQRGELGPLLAETRYDPPATHPHRPFIKARRAAAKEYLFGRRHDAREFIIILGAAAAIVFDLWWPGGPTGSRFASISVFCAMALNDLVVSRWRRHLRSRLQAANRAQLESDRRRGL